MENELNTQTPPIEPTPVTPPPPVQQETPTDVPPTIETPAPVITPEIPSTPLKEEVKPLVSSFIPKVETDTPPVEEKKPIDPSTPALRTLADDIKKAVQDDNVSMVKMVVAEQKRRQEQGDPSIEMETEKPKNWFFIIGTIVCAVIGLGIIGFFVLQYQKNNQTVAVPDYTSAIIKVETKKTLNTDRLYRGDIIDKVRELRALNIPISTVEEVIFTRTMGTTTRELTTTDFFDRMEVRTPDILYRTVDPEFVFAIHSFEGNQPFLVFHTSSYEQTYAGMLEWEKSLDDDIGPLFYDREMDFLATSTAQVLAQKGFVDEIIHNKDTRVLRNEEGKIKLLYSLVDPTTVVITTNSYTFQEAMERLKVAKLIR